MKRLVYSTIILLFTGLSSTFAQKPGFFVKCTKVLGDEASKYVINFERLVGTDISEAFHCATVHANYQLNARLAWEKEYQLQGGEDEISICEYLKCDYLVILQMMDDGQNRIDLSARCINFRKKEVLATAEASFVTSINSAGFEDACRELSKKLIKELGNYEICAFQGPVSITVSSDLDSTNIEEYGVYCNESDQRYRKETVIKNHTFSDWKLQRKGIPWTEGTMTFYSDESTKITEEDGCHKCKSSNREGGLITTSSSSMKVKGTGISHESEYMGEKQDDTRVELQFLENGTYLVVAKGTSQRIPGEVKGVTKAEGTCDNEPQQTKTEIYDITIPLKVIFGPYAGKTTDKILQQKDEKKLKNPVTHEEEIISIDFSLKQKEN